MKRRDFLKFGASVGVAANALPIMLGGFPVRALGRSPLRSALSSASTNNNILVIVQLAGGNDGLNCIVPYNDQDYLSNRQTLKLDVTKDNLLVIPDHTSLAMHSAMTGMHDLYNARKMVILQNVGYQNPILSHFRGTDIWNNATDSNITYNSGWAGRLLAGLNPNFPQTIPSQPLAIQFGSSLSNLFLSRNGGMGIAINQLPTKTNPSSHKYDAIDQSQGVNPGLELDYIRTIQTETETYTQSLLNRSVIKNKVAYPVGSDLGDQLASIAQLIASGFSTKVYLVTQQGYDTHSNQLAGQSRLLSELSQCISAFQNDIEQFGVADNVALMTYSEFGRRVAENGSGTDHGTAAPLFVVGTKVINPGMRGSDPKLGAQYLTAGNLTYDQNYDFRYVYATMMSEWLGIDDASISAVLTSSNGEIYSRTINTWNNLGIFKPLSGVANSDYIPGLMLMENYPNPVSNQTTIEYVLPESMYVQLGVFNTEGIEVARIVDARQDQGIYRATFKPGSLPSGTYIYRLSTPKGELAKQMIVVK
jgi:uncharacterized protein (DUF1501 family)